MRRPGIEIGGTPGVTGVVVVTIYNALLQLAMLWGALGIFNHYFHTPWSRM